MIQLHILFVFLFLPSCIYTDNRKSITTAAPETEEDGWVRIPHDKLEIDSFIYRPSKLPLERFFSNLTSGEITAAFADIDISYNPQNFSNEAVERLIDAGFVPTYISIKNNSDSPTDVSPDHFILFDQLNRHEPIDEDLLPGIFREWNPKAIGANIYNATVVTTSFIVLIAASAAACRHNCSGNTKLDLRGGKVFNPTDKIIDVDYRDNLIRNTSLNGGDSAKGLIFYKLPSDTINWNDLRISYHAQSNAGRD